MGRMLRNMTLVIAASALVFGFAACAVESEKATVEKGGGDTGTTARVGDTVTLKGTAYKVTSVKTAKHVGDAYTGVRASGVFIVVNMTLTNKENEPAAIAEDLVRIVSSTGKEYTSSTDAAFAFNNSLFLLAEIQPDVPKRVVVVYDLPKNAVKGSKLQVKDFWSDSVATIELGL